MLLVTNSFRERMWVMDNNLSYDAFRRNLKTMIESRGINAKMLSEYIDSTPVTIRYITGARNPDLEYVYRISQFFGVTIDYLLGLNDSKHAWLTPEAQEVAELYSLSSEDDKSIVNAVLKKYRRVRE